MSVRVVVLPADQRRPRADPGPAPDALVVVLRDVADLLTEGWLRSLRRGRLGSATRWATRPNGGAAPLGELLDEIRAGLPADRVCLLLGPDPQDRVAEVEHRLALRPGAVALPGVEARTSRPTAALVDALLSEVAALEVDRREAAVLLADALTGTDLSDVAAGLPDQVRERVATEAAEVERSGIAVLGDRERLRLPSPSSHAGRGTERAPVDLGVELATSLLAVLDGEARRPDEAVARLHRARRRLARARVQGQTARRPPAVDASGRRLVAELGRRARNRVVHALPGTSARRDGA